MKSGSASIVNMYNQRNLPKPNLTQSKPTLTHFEASSEGHRARRLDLRNMSIDWNCSNIGIKAAYYKYPLFTVGISVLSGTLINIYHKFDENLLLLMITDSFAYTTSDFRSESLPFFIV